jgi:PLD-like domain
MKQVCPIRYHTEETVVKAIHRLAANASTCRVAVAYCGEAAHRFFPEAPAARPENFRIIVDASEPTVTHGLTNPRGLRHLLGLTRQVRSLKGLHAKVFVFDKEVALVGSVNMSAQSIEQQYQLVLEVSDSRIVRQLVTWFDNTLWSHAQVIDSEIVRRLSRLWPNRDATPRGPKTKAKLPAWRGETPQPPLGPSEFRFGGSKMEIGGLLSEFKNNECPYEYPLGASCWEVARSNEKVNKKHSKTLHSLMFRRSSWGKNNLEELFDLAHTYGKAANFHRPAFVAQNPEKVSRSLDFLLNGEGDHYIRFEKLLDQKRYKLNGLGEAGIIFLMHLWNPKEFPVLNKPIDKALKKLKFSFGRKKSQRVGQAYKDRTAAIRKIMERTGLKTFALVDHFLDAIGKGHIGRQHNS